MDVHDVRVALAAAVSAAESTPTLTCLPYVPDSIEPPMAYVQLESVAYDKTMARGQDELVFTVMLMVSRADDVSAQRQLDGFLSGSGPASIRAAIHAANGGAASGALDGTADFVHTVGTESAPRWFEYGDQRFHGVGLRVRVIGTGA